MLRRFQHSQKPLFAATVASSTTASSSFEVDQKRYASKSFRPKKRPKVGPKYVKDAQQWKDEWIRERQRLLADSLRGYVYFSSNKRQVPWDARFKPFDRDEKDGVHLVMKYFMDDKLSLCNYHQRPVKRMFCNVGLIGPQVTTVARWKPARVTQLPATATKLQTLYEKDRSIRNHGLND